MHSLLVSMKKKKHGLFKPALTLTFDIGLHCIVIKVVNYPSMLNQFYYTSCSSHYDSASWKTIRVVFIHGNRLEFYKMPKCSGNSIHIILGILIVLV